MFHHLFIILAENSSTEKIIQFLFELIQNSIDAIKARRILENRPEDWGDIIVRSGKDSETHWIEIEDNGIGMSPEVLKGPF